MNRKIFSLQRSLFPHRIAPLIYLDRSIRFQMHLTHGANQPMIALFKTLSLRQMGISLGGGSVLMPKQLSNGQQINPLRSSQGRKAVAEIVNANVIQANRGTEAETRNHCPGASEAMMVRFKIFVDIHLKYNGMVLK